MSTLPPYPEPEYAPEQAVAAPPFRLFDSNAVGLATFLGTPVAGATLMAVNYKRLRNSSGAVAAVILGLFATGIAILLGTIIPSGASMGIAVALIVAMRTLAQSLQGNDVQQHMAQGGRLGSKWAAAGIAVGYLAVVFVGVFAFVVVQGLVTSTPKVIVGTKDEIFYSGAATQQEANALGAALKETGYLSDRGVTVMLSKDTAGTAIGFVVKDGIWDQPAMVASFERIALHVAPSVGGFPIKMRLADTARQTKKEISIGKAVIGAKDVIYYLGSATEANAQALGQVLRRVGFFADRGFVVLLAKDPGATVSFVVREGAWDEASTVNSFAGILRGNASVVGGLPLRMQFINSGLETKKEVVVD